MNRPRTIPDLEAALRHARNATPEERQKSALRLLSRKDTITVKRTDLELYSQLFATIEDDVEAR